MNLFTWEGLTDDTLLFIEEGERLVYGKDLNEYYERLDGRLKSRKLLFLLCKNTAECVMMYLSALRSDTVTLLLDENISDELLRLLIKQYEPDYIAYSSEKKHTLKGYVSYAWLDDYKVYLRENNLSGLERDIYKDLSLLLTTSGSTGSPKLVRLSRKNIEANANSIISYLHLSKDERPITTLPMHYTYGLSIIHSHLMVDAPIVLTLKSIFEREFWSLLHKEKVTSLSGVPYTYEMLKRVGLLSMKDLPLKSLTQAGGKLPESLQEEYGTFAKANGIEFFIMYGQTEATARMGYLPPNMLLSKTGSMGIAIPGGRFELIDDNGKVITKSSTVGELVYYGDNVALGYAECIDDLSKEDEWKGCLKTGDLASKDDDGYYYIKGRNKRFVKLYGNRISLDEVERIVKNRFDLDVAITGNDNGLILYSEKGRELNDEEVGAYLWEVIKVPSKDIEFKVIESIPRNASGKIIYKELLKK